MPGYYFDEFTVGQLFKHAIRRTVERLRAATPEEQTCSVGLVLWDGSESAERMFGRADKALYEAKESGRDRIVTG